MNTQFHKIINIAAKVLAVVIIVSIISAAVKVVLNFVGLSPEKENTSSSYSISEDLGENATELDIELKAADVKIIGGEKFSYSTNNKNISVSEQNGKISIKESGKGNYKDNNIEITVPSGVSLAEFDISSGAGNISIDSLSADEIDLELGAGNFTADSLVARSVAKIEAGAGNIVIGSGTLNNLDMDLGAGKAEISASINGNSSFNCGVGDLVINACGNSEDYRFDVSKGIGKITVDGKALNDGDTIGNGTNRISISGGIGNVKVSFA